MLLKPDVIFVSTLFPEAVPFHYQGSRKAEEPLDILYAIAFGMNQFDGCYYNVWQPNETDISNVKVIILSTTNSYLQWNNHPMGISFVEMTFRRIREIFSSRSDSPSSVVFGPHVPAHHHELYELGAHAVFIGEAERVVVLAARRILDSQGVSDLPGYVAKGAGKLPRPEKIYDLNMLPCPAYESTLHLDFWAHNNPGLTLSGHLYETSRGCPFFCAYCNTVTHRRKYRTKSTDTIASDLSRLRGLTEKEYVYFIDESWGYDEKWTYETLGVLAEIDFSYGCQGNLLFMSSKKAEAMAAAGFVSVEFGFETADVSVLNRIGKNNEVPSATNKINALCYNGISPLLFVLFGLPGESYESVKNTLNFLRRLDSRTRISVAMPTPYFGTRLHKMGLEAGQIDPLYKGEELYSYTGRIGHGLTINDSLESQFRDRYGPNNLLSDNFLDQFEQDVLELFSLRRSV